MARKPILILLSRIIMISQLLWLFSACATTTTQAVPDSDLDRLLAAFQANNERLEQRRKASLERGITRLDVVIQGSDPSAIRVSAELNNARLQVVLNRILELSQLSYSIETSNIHGTVSARLVDQPLLKTLNLLLDGKGLSASLRDDAIVIRQGSVEDKRAVDDTGQLTGPLTGELTGQLAPSVIEYPLRYLKTQRAQAILKELYPVNEDTGQRAISFAIRPENNSILLAGSQPGTELAAELLRALDTDSGHVLIEALVVEFNTEAFLDIGSRLAQGAKGNFSEVFLDFADLVGDTISFTMASEAANTTTFMAVINLLIQDEQARVISRPYMTMASGTSGQMEIAEDRFVVSSVPGADEITLGEISSGVKMNITPVVTADKLIQLDMNISESRFVPSLENVEQRRTRNTVTTSSRVEDGQTVIIGGLMLATQGHSVAGIPGLRDIPGLNLIFGHTDASTQRTQVLVFVTPHLWVPGMKTPVLPLESLRVYNDDAIHRKWPANEQADTPVKP